MMWKIAGAVGLSFALLAWTPAWGQAELDESTIAQYQEESRQMVAFLTFTLNTIGDPLTTARQKETIIQESYLKIFRDAKVQVEDDLVEGRSVVTNKDIQAYLKDIDFFFQEVRFEILVKEITHEVTDAGQLYFKVNCDRTLQGINSDGDTIYNSLPRFIEINLNPETRDLKIVSLYTTKLSEREELANWWNEMPWSWREVFAQGIMINDTLSMADIAKINGRLQVGDTLISPRTVERIMSDSAIWQQFAMGMDSVQIGDTLYFSEIDSIPLSTVRLYADLKALAERDTLSLIGYPQISSLTPLSMMTRLSALDVSHTQVRDLVPIRNLTKLERLNISHTQVKDLRPLRYALDLKELDASHTPLDEISTIERFSGLTSLNVAHTRVKDLTPIAKSSQLRELIASNTAVENVAPLQGLAQLGRLELGHTSISDLTPLINSQRLQILKIGYTGVQDLQPLSNAQDLQILWADSTGISSLEPLEGLAQIRKVYCDNSGVNSTEAMRFMAKQPDCLVIFESASLQEWWKGLSASWKQVLSQTAEVGMEPGREGLHQVSGIEELDISEHPKIKMLDPLRMLVNLKVLNIAGTQVEDLAPLAGLLELTHLNFKRTPVADLGPLQALPKVIRLEMSDSKVTDLTPIQGWRRMRRMEMERTGISSLVPLAAMTELRRVYADESEVNLLEVVQLSESQPKALVIFRTGYLKKWWATLPDNWKSVFRVHVNFEEEPNRDQLHRMGALRKIGFQQSDISDLGPLKICFRLEELRFSDVQVSSIATLANFRKLRVLAFSRTPVTDLTPLMDASPLRELYCSETPVADLSPIEGLVNLEVLDCSGTQVKSLKPLTEWKSLVRLDCSITQVKNLKPLEGKDSLKLLRCFNTKIPAKKVDQFKSRQPNVEVVFY
ncbi:leucine-rich repeat domain-containing protein [Pontibacter sp. G13]|uniref:leucine-rich repeat domain-containing protein n=1 Tax=Pontibacter sp. G13 TaxID=3074898 RepID=UPI00288B7742|nr:leucine-rich repeat domain-containing protein [Pontibacter sp. G13]WNJ19668.1 hypothetical protein RJD25_04225 [Pontibacter sp. G13]